MNVSHLRTVPPILSEDVAFRETGRSRPGYTPATAGTIMTKEEADDIKRHFDIVAEGLRDEIRLVADGVAMNSERLDRVEGRFDSVEGKIVRVEGRLDGVDGKLVRVEGKLDRIDGELTSFRAEVRHEFAEVRSAIKLSYAELDGRLTKLESSQANLQTRVERLEAKLAS